MDLAVLYNAFLSSIHVIFAVVLVFALVAAGFAIYCASHCMHNRKMLRKGTHALSQPIEDV